jgi:uncharacterized repeat protein (TIGR03806 family)
MRYFINFTGDRVEDVCSDKNNNKSPRSLSHPKGWATQLLASLAKADSLNPTVWWTRKGSSRSSFLQRESSSVIFFLNWIPIFIGMTRSPYFCDKQTRGIFLFISIFMFISFSAYSQPYGIETRVSNTTLLIDSLPPDAAAGSMQAVRVFPQVTIPNIALLVQAPGFPDRFFATDLRGIIWTFPHDPNVQASEVTQFLDIQSQTNYGGEKGLLGLAFDPDYATNGEFYVHYTYDEGSSGTTRISRFRNPNPGDLTADPGTEEVLLERAQPYSNHNGGMIAFGPDDLLYIGLGDGGSGNDPLNAGQDLTTILGKILRIDVRSQPDPNLNYKIPEDNPFFAGGNPSATRKEIYAFGLRNPWRFSFDRQNGTLYCGDVGQNAWEEIDVIVKGGNYGWKIMEGAHCRGNAPSCATTEEMILPIAEYVNPTIGRSVTGGYVYYGSEVPELYGKYLYADYVSGRIWSLSYDGNTATEPVELINSSGLNIAGFGQDVSGEVYLCNLSGGGIYVLRPADPGSGGDFPTRLSDMPSLLAAGSGVDQTTAGIIPYEPSAKLWSDNAHKERYIAIPGVGQIGYQEYDGWDFPEETVLIKNFLLPLDERIEEDSLKRIETRLLIKKDNDWHGFSYEWNEEETDAVLLSGSKRRPFTTIDENGDPFDYEWYYPNRTDCMTCHTQAANRVLGLNTPQMNFDFEYPASGVTDNQLRTYDHISLFEAPLPDTPDNLPRMPESTDLSASLEDRSRAYLAANCANCHQPAGPTNSAIDLRWQVATGEMNALGVEPNDDLGAPGAKIIDPGSASTSTLWLRMRLRGDSRQMPPLATSRVDEEATAHLAEWIKRLGAGMRGWEMY